MRVSTNTVQLAMRMATGRHGKLEKFNAGVDNVEDYKERFLLFCAANGLEDADKLKAVFLTCVGTATYTLLKNLVRPEKPQDKSLDELFKLLKSHFQPRIVVIAERFRFYHSLQREGETIANYMTELRRLSKHCDFGDYLDTVLRDQLVCGLYHEDVQRKILAKSELPLTKAVHIAQAAETARDETHALRGNAIRRPPAKQVETAFSVQRDTTDGAYKAMQLDSIECYRCGGRGHHPSTCKFKSQKCHFCRRQGHIRVCRKRSQQDELKKDTAAVRTTAKGKPQPTHEIDEDTVSVVFAQSGKGGVKITLEVGGSQIPMEVDTGATVTVIPISVYEQYLTHVQLHASTVSMKTYSGGSLKVKGEATVPVRYGEQHATPKIIVVDVRGKPTIPRRNWLSKIRLDWGSLFSVEARQMFDPKENFSKLFGSGVGTVQGHEARITLTAKAKPRFHRPRPVPHALQEKVNQKLHGMQREGVIRPVEKSGWATPVVVIRKGDGTVRLCGDYKVTLNPYLDMGGYPMPNPRVCWQPWLEEDDSREWI